MRRLCIIASLSVGMLGLPVARAGEGTNSPTGEIRLASGPRVFYEYHFDRNAFDDSVDLPTGLVALTRSGNLLRFDPMTRKRDREWFGPSRVTCLGRGEGGSAVVGFEDGRIARLDPATLALTVVATLPGKPHWVGAKTSDGPLPGGIVAVVERWRWFDATRDGLGQLGFPTSTAWLLSPSRGHKAKTNRQEWMPYSEVHDLDSGRSCAIDGRASTVFLDRKHRVWLGYELGEFGGWCRRVALSADQARVVPGPFDPADFSEPTWDCVLGFAELRDGQVWTLGGVMHMAGSITIRRVDGVLIENLLDLEGKGFGNDEVGLRDHPFGPGKPDSPIERIVEEAKPGSLLGFSENETIYRTDATLKNWDKIHELDLRFAQGRPEVGDSYSNVRAVHLRDGGLLCATSRDGYVFVVPGGEDTKDLVADQLEAHSIQKIDVTSEGTFFRDPWSDESAWRFKDRRWSLEPINLPGERGASFATSDGNLWSVEGGREDERPSRFPLFARGWGMRNFGPGQLLRLVDGKRAKLADLPGAFGENWLHTEYLDDGEMFYGDKREVRRMRRKDGTGFPMPMPAPGKYPIGEDLRVVNQVGPPWAVFDSGEEQLLGLTYGPEFRDPRFAPIRVEEVGLPLNVYDAIAWSREEVLIATRKGLKLCEIATGRHRPAPLPSPERPVKRLARDGLNRLWLGGEGLWMIDEQGRLHDLAAVPMVGRSTVVALSADPQKKDGLIVSLGIRGLAFLRVEASGTH